MAPRPHRRERRWFRRLVALLPFDTRRDYGHAMEQDFLLEYGDRAIQGRGAIGRLWLETIAGLFAFARRDQWTATKDDLRQTLRGWRRSPALSLVLLATMAAGITGVVVAFAVIDAVVLRPLPVPDPPTLVRVGERHEQNPQLSNVTYATFLDLEERSGSLTSLAASRFAFLNLTGEGTPERLLGAQVSGAFFDALGVPPVTGRLLTRDDDRDGEDAVAVISERLWRSRFGGEESTVGRRVRLNNTVREIVGILPAGAAYPLGTDVWVPLVARGSGLESNRRFHGLLVIGRIGPAATGAAVRAELGTIASSINTAEPEADPDLDLGLESVLERTVAPVRPALWTTLAATLLLLVVLGTNVAHVQLARAAAREREFALRSALGASRGRLARLLLTESVALALVAGGIGIGVAWLAVGSLPAWLPTTLPRAEAIGFDWRAAAAGLAVALVVGLGVGGWPAVRTAAPGALGGVRIVGGSGTGARRLPGRVLASLQLALTFALVVIAGLVVRSAVAAAQVPLGFAADGLVLVDLSLSPGRVSDSSDGDAYVGVLDPLLRRLESIPGVTATGLSTTPPLAGGAATSFRVVGEPLDEGREPLADIRIVDPGYFDVLQVPLLSGRRLSSIDRAGAPPVMVVSETLARRHFPDGRAVGRSITMLNWGPPITAEVVGVVGDVVGQDLERPVNPTIYWHYPQFPQIFTLSIVVRTARDEASIVPEIRRAIWKLEPNQPLPRIEPMTSAVSGAQAQRRTVTALLAGLAGAAALVALVGLYGVLSHTAARDMPAHGVRIALGARGVDIARLVMADALRVCAAGVAIGGAVALAGGRAVESLLFQTSARDGVTFAVAGGMIVVAGVAAALGPAWRAARVDPLVALRRE